MHGFLLIMSFVLGTFNPFWVKKILLQWWWGRNEAYGRREIRPRDGVQNGVFVRY